MSTAATKIPLPVLDDSPRVRLEVARSAHWGRHLSSQVAGAVSLRRAQPADAPAIHALLEIFVAEGRLLPRSLEQVYRTIRDFVVAMEGDELVGCGALRIYSDTLGEVVALAIAPRWRGRGVGRTIVRALRAEAEELGLSRIFALTEEEIFFHRVGFRRVDIAEFPQKIAQDCAVCAKRTRCIEIAVVHELETASHGGRP